MKPLVPMSEFCQKFGFKKCKRPYDSCYYLCVARGKQMIFLSPQMIDIVEWDETDPRIHKKVNCYFSDIRTAEDILVQLVQHGMVGTDLDKPTECQYYSVTSFCRGKKQNSEEIYRCYATREYEECTCGGDITKCDKFKNRGK